MPGPIPATTPEIQRLLEADAQDVLIIKPSSLGDVVHTLPAVALLKQYRPGWRLRWLVNPEWAPLLEGNPALEPGGVIPFPRAQFRGVAGLPRLWQWLGELRSTLPGTTGVADFQGLARSALIGKWLRPQWLAGLGDAREGAGLLHNIRVPVAAREHSVRRYLRLTAALCATQDLPQLPGADLPFPLPPGDPIEGFDPATPYLVLHPFSRGQDKSLAPEQVGELCRRLPGWRIIVAGRCDAEVAQRMALPAHALSLLNCTTLPQFLWLLRGARFTISVDSGPMHIAAALGPQVLGIHTWSNPAQVGPIHPEAWVWKAGELLTAGACQDARYTCPKQGGVPDSRELRRIAEFTLGLLG